MGTVRPGQVRLQVLVLLGLQLSVKIGCPNENGNNTHWLKKGLGLKRRKNIIRKEIILFFRRCQF